MFRLEVNHLQAITVLLRESVVLLIGYLHRVMGIILLTSILYVPEDIT